MLKGFLAVLTVLLVLEVIEFVSDINLRLFSGEIDYGL